MNAPHKVVLICGGRAYAGYRLIYDAIKHDRAAIRFVIQGGARGADAHAKNACVLQRVPQREFRAEWDVYGRDAGPLRNGKMLEALRKAEQRHHNADLDVDIEVWAFKDELTGGTRDMVEQAARAGVRVRWYFGRTLAWRGVTWTGVQLETLPA